MKTQNTPNFQTYSHKRKKQIRVRKQLEYRILALNVEMGMRVEDGVCITVLLLYIVKRCIYTTVAKYSMVHCRRRSFQQTPLVVVGTMVCIQPCWSHLNRFFCQHSGLLATRGKPSVASVILNLFKPRVLEDNHRLELWSFWK